MQAGAPAGHPDPALSVVVVTWNSAGEIGRLLRSLAVELRAADELIMVDNGSSDNTLDRVSEAEVDIRLVANDRNIGFVDAVNQGAALAEGDLVVLLNPDTEVDEGWRTQMLIPFSERYGWGAWQPLVTSDAGSRINSDGNQIHFTGVCWAGDAGRSVTEGPDEPQLVGYASGACMAVPTDLWRKVGGLPPRVFMYGDDVDICLRLRLMGHPIGIVPEARVHHEYEFDKGPAKWRYLERSRWAFILRTYPSRLLAVMLPGLALTELALIAVAAKQGWLGQKLLAFGDVVRWLPDLVRERTQIQRQARISAREFSASMAAELDSEYLPGPAAAPFLNAALRAYWRLACALL